MTKNLWPGDFTNIISVGELAKQNITTVKGLLECDTCGPEKMTINIAEAHNELAHFITLSYSKLNKKAPLLWKKVELVFYCTRCGLKYLSVIPPKKDNKVNFPFLYLIEALGSLTQKQLNYYCRKNHLRPKVHYDDLLYQVYYHIGTRFEGKELRPALDDAVPHDDHANTKAKPKASSSHY